MGTAALLNTIFEINSKRDTPDLLFLNDSISDMNSEEISIMSDMTFDEFLSLIEDKVTKIAVHRKDFRDEIDASIYFHMKGIKCLVEFSNSVEVVASGHSATLVQEVINNIVNLIPEIEIEEAEEDEIEIKFWNLGIHGAVDYTRKLVTQKLTQIQDNYNAEVLNKLNELFDIEEPKDRGKIVLFHGVPGTGKTHAIRAYARHISKWCDCEFVIDPDALFTNTDYLMKVIMNGGQEEDEKYRLIIMEDIDDFIKETAKDKNGQAVSRLLNVTEGLIGQGMKLLFLITTNEPMINLHKAMTRPGRCLKQIEFKELTTQESVEWCKKNGKVVKEEKPHTIAELFNL